MIETSDQAIELLCEIQLRRSKMRCAFLAKAKAFGIEMSAPNAIESAENHEINWLSS